MWNPEFDRAANEAEAYEALIEELEGPNGIPTEITGESYVISNGIVSDGFDLDSIG